AAINFAATPYVLQDATTSNSGDLTAANVTTGLLAANKSAVLFNSAISVQKMIDAWDPGEALGTLFIPVENFPSLGNGGDTIAIWDNMADYAVDAASSMPARTTEHAAAVLAYD